tara:strand:- start:2177 stop:3253 length:1077 start_codon:yes stop_codon:yes gene_type:complete
VSWSERSRAVRGLCSGAWSLSLAGLHWLRPFLVIAMVSLILFALFSPKPFSFSIKAETEHVTLMLSPDQQVLWRIAGAQLCIRAGIEPLPYPVLDSASSPCSGRRWESYNLGNLNDTTHELALRFPMSGSIVRLDTAEDGALLVHINSSGEEPDQLSLITAGSNDPDLIGFEAILRFPRPGEDSPPGRMVLPFSGSGSIGKDVSWRESTLLRKGSIELYTHSDEAVGGRALVASTELMPGDRIDLNHEANDRSEVTKGFIHYDLLPELTEPVAMTVVAFGTAKAIRIIRFGDAGYTFSPGLIARLMHHSAVTTWAVAIFSLLTLMAIYSETSGICHEASSWRQRRVELRRHWQQFWRG